jgi:hypothetical protein
MPQSLKRMLFWSPRVLSILFVLFISLFALDVFNEGLGFWQTLLALLIHLIPTGLVIVAIVLAWYREWIGAVLFIAGGLWYLFANLRHVSWILTISGPMLLIGILFLLSWLYRKDLRVSS